MLEKAMRQLRQGDGSALAVIYTDMKNAVFAVCFAIMRDYQLAEDMMQDTFLRLKNRIDLYNEGTNARTWILTLAKNICLNELKRRKREVASDFESLSIADSGKLRAHDESGVISAVIKNLGPAESKIVLMHTVGGISLKEIAGIFHKPQGTVRWQYNNALKKLRKILKREELYE